MNQTNTNDEVEDIIGYSAFDEYEELFGYIENSCFIADSMERLRKFIDDFPNPEDHKPYPVRLSDIIEDYGVSSGRFAIESEALAKFRREAEKRGIKYELEPYGESLDNSSELFYLKV